MTLHQNDSHTGKRGDSIMLWGWFSAAGTERSENGYSLTLSIQPDGGWVGGGGEGVFAGVRNARHSPKVYQAYGFIFQKI